MSAATVAPTELDALLSAPLPPCEVRMVPVDDPQPIPAGTPTCGLPARAVLTFTCPRCGSWRRSACAPHVAEVQLPPHCCGRCGHESFRIEVSS